MPGLINKLNVLVKSSLNSVLGDESPDTPLSKKTLPLARLGKNIDQEIAALRQQINQALDDEDRMESEIDTLQNQMAGWDEQADLALQQGDEANSRYAIRQMQLQQQRAAMLVADLAQHRRSTSELIQRVNELEALVAQARYQAQTAPAEDDDESLSARLRRARQDASDPVPAAATPAAPPAVNEKAVEDDLARRRARLS
jgi:phage shock protein A